MDPSSSSTQALAETDHYLHFDPKAPRGRAGAAAAPSRQSFTEAIVFVVGGGGYVEYTNLMEYSIRTQSTPGLQGRKITYGSTEILTPDGFVKALGGLV